MEYGELVLYVLMIVMGINCLISVTSFQDMIIRSDLYGMLKGINILVVNENTY